jgi:amino acid transporter
MSHLHLDQMLNSSPAPVDLRRRIGRWALTALVINGIVGSGIFGLPAPIAKLLGRASPWAYVIAATVIAVIMACFAEVSARFRQAGGPYLYAKVAFGRFIGLQIGWLTWLARLTATAAVLNVLVMSLGEFWPRAGTTVPRLLVLTAMVTLLAIINFRGVGIGAQVSNGFALIKLLSLFGFTLAGCWYLLRHGAAPHPASATAHAGDWFTAVLMLIFMFGGIEAAVIPAGETRQPARDAPFALFTALVIVAAVFTLIQVVVVQIVPVMTTDRPLAEAARQFAGGVGAGAMAMAAIVSVCGNLASQMLTAPRLTFALAENGDFPEVFGKVHPRFRTPHVSIVIFAALTWMLAVCLSFSWNVAISAVARLFTYGAVCAALPILRRMDPQQKTLRLPAGTLIARAGVVFSAVLVATRWKELIIVVATATLATINWLLVRHRQRRANQLVGPSATASAT